MKKIAAFLLLTSFIISSLFISATAGGGPEFYPISADAGMIYPDIKASLERNVENYAEYVGSSVKDTLVKIPDSLDSVLSEESVEQIKSGYDSMLENNTHPEANVWLERMKDAAAGLKAGDTWGKAVFMIYRALIWERASEAKSFWELFLADDFSEDNIDLSKSADEIGKALVENFTMEEDLEDANPEYVLASTVYFGNESFVLETDKKANDKITFKVMCDSAHSRVTVGDGEKIEPVSKISSEGDEYQIGFIFDITLKSSEDILTFYEGLEGENEIEYRKGFTVRISQQGSKESELDSWMTYDYIAGKHISSSSSSNDSNSSESDSSEISGDPDNGQNKMIYIIGGVAAVLIIGGAAFAIIRKEKHKHKA